MAIGLSAAVAQLHQHGIIHKDIKPPNVLVDSATGQCWLIGFGIASRFPRERQAPEPPEVIAGTLAYMAPEQTGRMNRSIDSRSDLYALGVTLYEMLTGGLPFTASDPMEWVHCHTARQPVPPGERVKNTPSPVSAIIMKLLAKTAEERYQTAVGVERDLRRCLAEWDSRRRINEFRLGEHDIPDRLLIPEKLYGRASEIETLLAAFDRIVAGGRPELVLVSGYSGIGKSSVVNELYKPLVPPRGSFASGKFDQYKRDIPYATLAQAFQSLLRPLLTKSEAELGKWRDALREALDPNGQLIVDLVPELKLVIGEQPAVPEVPTGCASALPASPPNRLPLETQKALQEFACLGNRAETAAPFHRSRDIGGGDPLGPVGGGPSGVHCAFGGFPMSLSTTVSRKGPDAKTSEAENAVSIGLHQSLQKSSCFRQGARTHYRFHRKLEQSIRNTSRLRFFLAQTYAGKFRIRKKAKWHLPSRCHALTASDAVVDHAEIVNANVGKLRAASYLADRPNPGRCGLQPLIHFDPSSTVPKSR